MIFIKRIDKISSKRTNLLSRISCSKVCFRGSKVNKTPILQRAPATLCYHHQSGGKSLLHSSAINARQNQMAKYSRERRTGFTPKRDACTRAEFDVVVPQDKEIIKINEPSLPGIHNKYGVLDKNTGDISLYTKCLHFWDKTAKIWVSTDPIGVVPLSDACQKNDKSGIPLQKEISLQNSQIGYTPINDHDAETFDLPTLANSFFIKDLKKSFPEEHSYVLKEMKQIHAAKFNRIDRKELFEEVIKEAKRRIAAKQK